jgi:RNA polymerase sigma-70 factor (ECF subfamily)
LYAALVLLPEQDNDSAAFDELVDRYERRIFNLIYRLVGEYEEAADLTQDAFVAAFRSFASFRAEAEPYTWLYRIAINVCKNRFRQRDRLREVEAASVDGDADLIEAAGVRGLSDEIPTPERALEASETRRLVEEAIGRLPEDYRVVVVLRDMQGLSYREIAEAADISVDVVRTRLARARAMLRERLAPFLAG